MPQRFSCAILLLASVFWNDPVRAADTPPAIIPLTVEFSLDGKQYQAQSPAVPHAGKFWVRASWKGFQRPDDARQPYLALLIGETDFASADNGRQRRQGAPVYIQRPEVPYVARSEESVVFTVDLGPRKEGVSGRINKWDSAQGKFVDAPLPAIEALPAGVHLFTVQVYYRAADGGKTMGLGKELFAVTVENAPNEPETVIYVAPNGDDANPGTAEKPLATLRKALSDAKPGTRVTLKAGTYREGDIAMTRGGDVGKPLVIEGEKAGQVFLKGSQVVTGWKLHAEGVWKIENWTVNSQQLFADGQPLQQIGVQNRWHRQKLWADHVCLPPVGKGLEDLQPGSFYYDAAGKALYCMLADKGDPNARLMEASVKDCVLHGQGASHVTLRNLSFLHNNMTGNENRNGGLVAVGKSNWTLENCEFSYADFAGLGMSGENHIVRRCRIFNNGAVGVDINGSDAAHNWRRYQRPAQNILLEDLVVTGNNYRKFFDQWHAGGMKCVPCNRGVTVRRCSVTNNHGAGIWFDGGLGDIVIEDNLVADNLTGIFYEISSPAEGDPFGALIRNNRVINHPKQGIYISASSQAIVANNTCFRNRWDIVLHGMPRQEFGGCKLAGNRIRDNIVCGKVADIILFMGQDASDNVVDGNFYVTGESKAAPRFGIASVKTYEDRVYTDLGKLSEAEKLEAHGLSGDPQWVAPAEYDFRLKSGSPAAGKGWQPKGDGSDVQARRPEK